jgi:lysozyme
MSRFHKDRWFPLVAVALAASALVGPFNAPPARAANRVSGVDVSHWNGAPNWLRARRSGVRFVIAKATDGRTFVDPAYARNKADAEQVGLYFTAYHYARPSATPGDARAQARHFVKTARLTAKNLVPALDLEQSGGLPPAALAHWVRAFLSEVRDRLGVQPMIYSSPSFWATHMANSTWFAENGYPLWVAHWGVPQPRVPAQRWAGFGWTMWQTTSDAHFEGFRGRVDHDVYAASSLSTMTIATSSERPSP